MLCNSLLMPPCEAAVPEPAVLAAANAAGAKNDCVRGASAAVALLLAAPCAIEPNILSNKDVVCTGCADPPLKPLPATAGGAAAAAATAGTAGAVAATAAAADAAADAWGALQTRLGSRTCTAAAAAGAATRALAAVPDAQAGSASAARAAGNVAARLTALPPRRLPPAPQLGAATPCEPSCEAGSCESGAAASSAASRWLSSSSRAVAPGLLATLLAVPLAGAALGCTGWRGRCLRPFAAAGCRGTLPGWPTAAAATAGCSCWAPGGKSGHGHDCQPGSSSACERSGAGGCAAPSNSATRSAHASSQLPRTTASLPACSRWCSAASASPPPHCPLTAARRAAGSQLLAAPALPPTSTTRWVVWASTQLLTEAPGKPARFRRWRRVDCSSDALLRSPASCRSATPARDIRQRGWRKACQPRQPAGAALWNQRWPAAPAAAARGAAWHQSFRARTREEPCAAGRAPRRRRAHHHHAAAVQQGVGLQPADLSKLSVHARRQADRRHLVCAGTAPQRVAQLQLLGLHGWGWVRGRSQAAERSGLASADIPAGDGVSSWAVGP